MNIWRRLRISFSSSLWNQPLVRLHEAGAAQHVGAEAGLAQPGRGRRAVRRPGERRVEHAPPHLQPTFIEHQHVFQVTTPCRFLQSEGRFLLLAHASSPPPCTSSAESLYVSLNDAGLRGSGCVLPQSPPLLSIWPSAPRCRSEERLESRQAARVAVGQSNEVRCFKGFRR